MHVFNESNVFILFHFLWGCYGGALVFLGGAGALPSAAHDCRLHGCATCTYITSQKTNKHVLGFYDP